MQPSLRFKRAAAAFVSCLFSFSFYHLGTAVACLRTSPKCHVQVCCFTILSFSCTHLSPSVSMSSRPSIYFCCFWVPASACEDRYAKCLVFYVARHTPTLTYMCHCYLEKKKKKETCYQLTAPQYSHKNTTLFNGLVCTCTQHTMRTTSAVPTPTLPINMEEGGGRSQGSVRHRDDHNSTFALFRL